MSEYFVGTTGSNSQTTFEALTTSEVLDDLGLNTGDAPTFSGLFVNSTGTGANNTLFSVDGSNGRLFGVTDEVTGTVFSVNDAAGLPILEVESTSSYDKITVGEYGSDLLVLSGQTTAEVTGSQIATQDWIDDQGFLTSATDGNFYLTGVSKSGNTFTFGVDGASDPTYTLTSGDITGALGFDPVTLQDDGSVEAEEFIGDLRGAVSFRAKAGEALSAGEAVYISGIDGNSTVVAKADADDSNKMPAFGVAGEDANANANVSIVNFGEISNLDTSDYSEGDELFISTTAGLLTGIAPAGESAALQKMAKVTRSHASSGSITVMGAGRSNAVPNLNEGRLFVGNSSNQAVADGTVHVDIADSRVGIGTTSPNTKLQVVGTVQAWTASGDAYSIAGTSATDSNFRYSGLRFDRTNNVAKFGHYLNSGLIERGYVAIKDDGNVGIGTTSPAHKLDVNGGIRANGNIVTTSASQIMASRKFSALNTSGVMLTDSGASNGLSIANGGNATFTHDLTVSGDLTVNGTTTTINSTTVQVDDKNIELGTVATPTDTTADGGGITLKGATDKTINWVNSTDAWTFSERISIPAGSAASPSLTFGTDTDTGIFNRTAGELNFAIGGNWIANIQSTGLKIYAGTGIFNRSGSAAAPSYTFTDDADTGIYRETSGGNDMLSFSTDGTRRGYFISSGFHVNGSIYSGTNSEFRNYSGTWKATTGATGNGFQFINSVDGTALTISSTGDTVASGSLTATGLDINGAADISGNLEVGEYILRSGQGSNYHRFVASRQIFVVGNASSIDLNNGVSTFGATGGATTLQGSSLLLDSADAIILDADDDGSVKFKDAGTEFGRIYNAGSNLYIKSIVSDKDLVLVGNDGGTAVEALRLDMSNAGNATFSGSVTATSLVKSGGSSAEFLKADGSVDSSTYLTTSSASSTYLPLSGGTMTGALNTGGNAFGGTYLGVNSGGVTQWGSNRGILTWDTGHATIYAASTNELRLGAGGGSDNSIVLDGSSVAINKPITTTSTVTATSLIKSGGSSSQFLKADGSVDSTTYVSSETYSTPSQLLTAIKTVDGSGSGLDADTLDNINSSSFLRSDANDTVTGEITGSGDPSLSGFFLPQNPEGRHVKAPWFFNDMAYARLKGATISVTVTGGSSPSNSDIDAMFDASTGFWNLSTSGVTEVVVEMTNPPKTMYHGSHMGVTFGNTTWRAKNVKLESYYNGQYNELLNVSNQSKEYVTKSYNSSSNAQSKLRWTFSNFNTTSMRIVSLFAYNYNATGMPSLYLTNDGGTMYGNISMAGSQTVDGRDLSVDGSKLDGIAANANNYSLPAASSSTRGGVKIGYSQSGKNYPVQVSSEQMFVNVPWTDTNTDTNTFRTVTAGGNTLGATETLALTAGSNVSISEAGGQVTISSTDTNTVYSHPTHAGDDINIDTGALTGATVISDLDFNITTNTLGHVTDANGSVSTRTLTAANLGISAPNAPTSLSATIVGETIDLTFTASTTSNIDAYLVYSSVDGGDYGLIQVIPPDDFSATMSVIDSAFSVTGTQAYRVYAMKYGILSTAGTASVSYTLSTVEPTNMSVINMNCAYFVQWDPPSSNDRFVSAYNVYKHEHATQGSLSRSSASLIYSGLNTNYMYQISGNNNNNFHQFWVETTIA